MSITLDQTIASGLFALAIFTAWITVAWLTERRRGRAEPQLWQTELIGGRLPEWDGQTWDWPEGRLGEYFFGDEYAYAGQAETRLPFPGPADGPSPNPSYADEPRLPFPTPGDGDDETDRYIQAMRDWADAFITAMSQPALAPAAARAGW